jgi:hypothetical protein
MWLHGAVDDWDRAQSQVQRAALLDNRVPGETMLMCFLKKQNKTKNSYPLKYIKGKVFSSPCLSGMVHFHEVFSLELTTVHQLPDPYNGRRVNSMFLLLFVFVLEGKAPFLQIQLCLEAQYLNRLKVWCQKRRSRTPTWESLLIKALRKVWDSVEQGVASPKVDAFCFLLALN